MKFFRKILAPCDDAVIGRAEAMREMARISGHLSDKEIIHCIYLMLRSRRMSDEDMAVLVMRINHLTVFRSDRAVH